MKLYHVTEAASIDSIRQEGLRAPSYWAGEDASALLDYYGEDLESPVVLVVEIDELDPELLSPDFPGIEEPITGAIGMTEEEVIDAWCDSEGTWRDSLDIIGSCRYMGTIAPRMLCMDDEWGTEPLLGDSGEAENGVDLDPKERPRGGGQDREPMP